MLPINRDHGGPGKSHALPMPFLNLKTNLIKSNEQFFYTNFINVLFYTE